MASKRRIRRKKCERKVAHQTMRAAMVAKKRTINGKELTPYRCAFCSAFHLGHRPGFNSREGVPSWVR